MSMELKCIYEEKFVSQITNKEYTYRDELYLLRVRDPYCWTVVKWYSEVEPKVTWGQKEINCIIYENYLKEIQTLYPEKTNHMFRPYSREENMLLIQGKATKEQLPPVEEEPWIEIHKRTCEEWFDKYGGIQNVCWQVM